jgi:hypothetical protein
VSEATGDLDPRDVIVPVLGFASPDAKPEVRGTGSIVGDGSILLTADHVIAGYTGQLAITTTKDPAKIYPVTVAERDSSHDLALLRIDGYRAERPLTPLFEFPFRPNWDVMTFEYSTTREVDGVIRLSPATRIGHITRLLTVDTLGAAGVDALELSFPAVRLSSGAPVVYNRAGFGLVGVLKSNALYHLLPTEVEVSLNAANTLLGETRYMLPQGIAVNIRHLRPMYERVTAGRPI